METLVHTTRLSSEIHRLCPRLSSLFLRQRSHGNNNEGPTKCHLDPKRLYREDFASTHWSDSGHARSACKVSHACSAVPLRHNTRNCGKRLLPCSRTRLHAVHGVLVILGSGCSYLAVLPVLLMATVDPGDPDFYEGTKNTTQTVRDKGME